MRKQLLVYLTFVVSLLFLLYLVLFALQRGNTLFYWKFLNYSLFLFLIPLVLLFYVPVHSWMLVAVSGAFLASSFLSYWASGSFYFLIPLVSYLILLVGFFAMSREARSGFLVSQLEVEKNLTHQNELQNSLSERQMKRRALQDKYLTYYNLRRTIEDLGSHLSFDRLSQMIALRAFEQIKKGDQVLLMIGTAEGAELRTAAARGLDADAKIKAQRGDFFDIWVIKNRQPLLIGDLDKDIRFSAAKRAPEHPFESAILVPLMLESAGCGVLRIDSFKKNNFSMDDLRLLQILSDLASTALINSFLYSKTEELAIHDSLTGLYVHRYFRQRLSEECSRTLSSPGQKLSLLLFDIDYFKKFNDYFGHTSGDIALQRIAQVIREVVSSYGLVARYGGEEFACILPGIGAKQALEMAEAIRGRIENLGIKIRDRIHKFTVSGGAAEFPREAAKEEDLIRAADNLLYRSKQGGRNQVCCASS